MTISAIKKWIRSKIPVSRGRYDRELELLKLSVSRSVEDERQSLKNLINQLSYCAICYRPDGMKRIHLEMNVSDDYLRFNHNPAFKRQMIYNIAMQVAEKLHQDL